MAPSPSQSGSIMRHPGAPPRVITKPVYSALLSRVAEAFQARIAPSLSERTKDGLAYKDAFDGREAVTKLAEIIKTGDRNLALLLGRALDAQKFFHDVTYDHRLRDSSNELYQFKTALTTPFMSAEEVGASGMPTAAAVTAAAATTMDDAPLPSGVFTLLTECYSPTCTRDRLCYSIACPRRLEQLARLNLSQNGGSANDRAAAAAELNNDTIVDVEPGTLWVHSVSQEVVDATPEKERRRQEAINELVYTERDFVRDMEYLRDQWVIPLTTRDIIPEARRKDFVTQVFWNIHEIIAVNTKLRDALTKRQKQRPVVEQIADIMMEHVGKFEPFIKYGAHQLYGKYEFEKEKNNNPLFSQFVDEVERLPESRKLELNGYLTKPTTRLARYPLLLGACLKVTEDDNPDKENIPQVIKIVKDFLERVNLESGRAENRFSLLQLDQQLVFRPGEAENLRLLDENRELVYKGPLKRAQGDNVDLQLFLFDHALLVVKSKTKHEQFKVHRKPIPLELLLISPTAEDPSIIRPGQGNRPRNTLVAKRNSLGTGGPQQSHQPFPLAAANNTLTRPTPGMHPLAPLPSDKADPKGGFPLTFIHLGRKGYTLTLWASTFVSRKKWIDAIVKQQEALRDRSTIFETWGISAGYFGPGIRVNCAAPLNHGQGIVMGTDDGVYFGDLRDTTRDPIKMLGIPEVTQVDVLEEYQLLVVLSERAVITFPLEALDPRDPTAGLKRAKRVSSHTSFFKAGMCLGKMLVCVVKASALSTTIKTLEPIETGLRGKNKPTFKKLLQGGNDTLKVFKEFYIPVESSSIHFLRTKLCVGCTKGFEIVDLETLDAQGLLDPNDSSLDFVQKRENVRPMAIYRVDSEFLLCYEDFAFYINKNGWRSRPGWIIHWEGTPTAFALHYPYVLAFEPTFIEVRHVETGLMAQVIVGTSIACLFADTPPSSDSAATHHQQQHHQQQQQQYHQQYPQHQIGGYSAPMMHAPPPPPPPHRRDLHKRDEIILSMDDRVVGLRRAIGR
ncbi:RhoGEF Rgf2 [Clavulina sp. PMI_390]|nr:RhoGEF Rgf2 [Clavulina sp. PMI_390]